MKQPNAETCPTMGSPTLPKSSKPGAVHAYYRHAPASAARSGT